MKKCVSLLLALLMLLPVSVPAIAADGGALEAIDYASPENWAYFEMGSDKEVDVFLICPTVDTGSETNAFDLNEQMKAQFLYALDLEKGMYEDTGRLFSPYYRQMAMHAYKLSEAERALAREIAYRDVSSAFRWYLDHENNDRPLILAGFSQGSDMCLELMKEYFGGESAEARSLRERLVAVYAIGWSVTEDMTAAYPQIIPAAGETDTGVVVSFDCEDGTLDSTLVIPEGTRALSINPLNWKTDDTAADKSLNAGAVLSTGAEPIPGLCGAYLGARGELIVTDVTPEEYPNPLDILPEGSYHVYDYLFFFTNLKQNVAKRTAACLSGIPVQDAARRAWDAEAVDIKKYGNVVLSTTCEELLDAGFAYGDVLEVRFLDRTLALPLCGNYSDVDSGAAGIFARAEDTNVVLAVNMGDFATSYGIAVKTENADQTLVWNYAEGVEGPVVFRISLREAGGYYDEYVMRQLSYSDARSDYPALTDAQFANFRAVTTTGMGGVLYRSASPLDPEHNRNAYADAALRAAGVTVVMNLADTPESARNRAGYPDSYYASIDSIALGMGMDFTAEDFQAKLAEGLRYLAAHPGVYAIQCKEGRDRTGFVCALLECLMGGSFDELIADYMETYYNYYGVTKDDARYEAIANSNIVKSLQRAFHVDELQTADLAGLARAYLKELGLSDAELTMLMENLSANRTAAQAQSPEEILAAMTTEEKVAQLVMPAFSYYTDENGETHGMAELTADAARAIGEYGFAGIVLRATNTADTEAAIKLLDEMQRANAGHKTRLLIAADQEGGMVTRLGQGTQMPGNMALGAANDLALTAGAAAIIGAEIMDTGINMDLAPVLDVNSNPANPVIGTRSFSDDPEAVATQGVAFLNALRATGAIATLKHFPGHGDTDTDSHTGLPCIDRSYEEIRAQELIPFKAAIDAGAEAVMTAHIQYQQIETATYVSKRTGEEITLPATLSQTIITDILRTGLGFDGVVITDAMGMDAIKQHFDRYDAAKLAIEAGVDIILEPVDCSTKEGIEELRAYIQTLAGMAERGEISSAAVDAAVLRVLKLKAAHGLTEAYQGAGAFASADVGSAAHHEAEWAIAKRAVTLVKNENNLLPLTRENETVVVLTAYDNEVLGMEYAIDRLRDENKLASGMDISVHSIQESTAEEALALTQGAAHVVVVSELYSAAGLTGDYAKKLDAILSGVHASGGDVSIMSCNLPYDVARYPDADAIVIAWSARGMSEDPRKADGAVTQYGPNMPAALYLMLSPDETPMGTLPVNIPRLDDAGNYLDEILYPRGYGLRYALFNAFSDLESGAWYAGSVDYVLRQGIMAGYGNGTFGAQDPLSRAQMAAMLWRMAGEPVVAYDLPFQDVRADAWYAETVRWAASEQIVTGTTETAFSPDAGLTREQAAVMLYRYAHAQAPESAAARAEFADSAEISDWAREALGWAADAGILRGSDGFLRPKDTLTRAEAAQLICNYVAQKAA